MFRAFRQALAWADARSLTERDATVGIKNPKRKRHERKPIVPFEMWEELEAIDEQLDELYRGIPEFATGTGLRPEEWIALHRSDVDRKNRLVRVCRRFSSGELKDGIRCSEVLCAKRFMAASRRKRGDSSLSRKTGRVLPCLGSFSIGLPPRIFAS